MNLTHNKLFSNSQRHESFVTNPKSQRCIIQQDLSFNELCDFVKNMSSCHIDEQYIDYIGKLFCHNSNFQFYFRFLIMIVLCLYLFFILGVTANKIFCPALTYLSDTLGLSENLAGATILAVGNGSPDIFTALASYDGDTEMFYAQMFGGGLFVVGVISALIIIIAPFTVSKYVLVRDVVFYMVSCLWITRAFRNEKFYYLEAIGAIAIYLIYITILIIEHILSKSKKEAVENHEISTIENSYIETADISSPHNSSSGANENLMKQFTENIRTFIFEDWTNTNSFKLIVYILKVPIIFVLVLMVPVVDSSLKHRGWNKLLNTLQIVLLPMFVIFVKQRYNISVFRIPIIIISVVITVPVAIVMFLTSRTDRPPNYQLLIAIFGSFIGSIIIISTCASEVISILSTIGNVSNISDSLLGLSLLSWGNSIGDLILNISLARKNLPKMGFSACFGGPIFNSLFTVGIRFNLKLYFSGSQSAEARQGASGPNCYIFLFILMLVIFLSFAFTNFQGRQSTGILIIMTYITFILFCFLSELEVLHPYGTDHQYEGFEHKD